jgi:hypothetical protein
VLHPPPLFAWLRGEGREPRRASHAAPVLPDRSSTPPEGGNVGAPRWCLHCSTQCRRWPRNLRLFLRLLPFLFSCFPPALFSLLLLGERSCSGGPSCGMRHRPEKSQIHRALCSAWGEDSRRGVSVRALLAVSLPHGLVVSIAEGEGA